MISPNLSKRGPRRSASSVPCGMLGAAVVAASCLSWTAKAADPVLAGQWPSQVRGNPNAVALVGNRAYVAAGSGGLMVFNISPSSLNRMGGYDTAGDAIDVAVSGSLAFVADADAGVQFIDVGSPSTPVRVGGYDTPGTAYGVAVSGSLVFVADDLAGLQIINVADPLNPVLVGSYNTTGRASGVTVSGNLAYVADGVAGLQIIDVTTPASPTKVATFKTGGWAQDVVVVSNRAFVADGAAGVMVIDVTNPASPSRLASYDTSGYGYGVTVSGSRIYLADADSGVQIFNFDATSGTPLTVLGNHATTGSAHGVALDDDEIFVADRFAGLQKVDISNPASPVLRGSNVTRGYAWSVAVLGSLAFIADDDGGLKVINVSNPGSAFEAGSFTTADYAYDVAAAGNYAYVAAGSAGLEIVNVTAPANPVRAASFVTAGSAEAVALAGNLAYVAAGFGGLEIINVSNPASPIRIGDFETAGGAQGVAISGNLALVAEGSDGLEIIDVSNPASPQRIGSYTSDNYAWRVAVLGNLALIAADEAGLEIVDISNPANPTRVGGYVTSSYAWSVAASGNLAFVAIDEAGVAIIDLTNPASPTLAGSYNTRGHATGVATVGDQIYVADGEWGMAILAQNVAPSLPTIEQQPLARTNAPGSVASFTVATGGLQPQTFQWRKDGVAISDGARISGATTDTMVITLVEHGDAGAYSVTVANTLGQTNSATAQLSVKLAQSITFAPLADQPLGAAPFNLTATAGSGLPVTFELVSGPASLAGSTLTVSGLGDVTVRASQAGDATYSAADSVERSFTVFQPNACPELALASPSADANVQAGNLLSVEWAGNDPDDEAVFNLYYDLDADPENGNETLIAGPIAAESGVLAWDTDGVTPGTYRIFGVLSDGQCQDKAYATGVVTVVPPPVVVFAGNPIEITQAIQTADNQLPLVAGKSTIVRVYARVVDAAAPEPSVVQLTATRDGTPLAGSPITATFSAPNVTEVDRLQLDHSALLSLPSAWTDGTVVLQASLTSAAGTIQSSPVTANFGARRRPTIWVIPINFGTQEAPVFPTSAEIAEQVSYLESVYPVSGVDAVVHYWGWSGLTNGSAILEQLQYYYEDTELFWMMGFAETGESPFTMPDAMYGFTPDNFPAYPGGPITGGVAQVGAKIAVGHLSESLEGTMAHGLNHSLDPGDPSTWGLHVTDPAGSNSSWGCGATGGDPNWPWTNDGIQEVGLDVRSLTPVPSSVPDFMSLCRSATTTGQWISTYRWTNLYNFFAPPPAAAAAARSQARRASPPQSIFYVSGTVGTNGTGELGSVLVVAGTPSTGNPAGAFSIQLLNGQGAVLETLPFVGRFTDSEGGQLAEMRFRFSLPARAGTAAVVLKQGAQVLDEIQVSAGLPTVKLTSPNGGELWDGVETINWEASDPDGDELLFTVAYSPDDGKSWLPITTGQVTGRSYEVNSAFLRGATAARLRIIATDGFNTASDQTDAVFSVAKKLPSVSIVLPTAGDFLTAGEAVTFEGFATDIDDGIIADNAYVWSLGAQPLGTGRRLTAPLPAGTHEVRLTVTDSDGNAAVASIQVVAGIQITSALTDADGVRLSFQAAANQGYSILVSDALIGGSWTPFGKVAPENAARIVQLVDSIAADGRQRFYRIAAE